MVDGVRHSSEVSGTAARSDDVRYQRWECGAVGNGGVAERWPPLLNVEQRPTDRHSPSATPPPSGLRVRPRPAASRLFPSKRSNNGALSGTGTAVGTHRLRATLQRAG